MTWLSLLYINIYRPYLQAGKREALADYSLPVAVITLSFVGSYLFQDVTVERFRYDDKNVFTVAPLERLSWLAVLGAMGLGFSLSLLFFMDQNITSAMVNNPCNKYCIPPVHCRANFKLTVWCVWTGWRKVQLTIGIFSSWLLWRLSCRSLDCLGCTQLCLIRRCTSAGWLTSKRESTKDTSTKCKPNLHIVEWLWCKPSCCFSIVKVRETRLTGMVSHFFIGLSLFLLPYPLAYIPTAVLDGLFLYMAVTALNGNQMFERITLLFMEQVHITLVWGRAPPPRERIIHVLLAGRLSAESLHPASSTAQNPSVHWMSGDAAAGHVSLRFRTVGLHEDGLPAHHPIPSARPTSARPATHRSSLPGSARRGAPVKPPFIYNYKWGSDALLALSNI